MGPLTARDMRSRIREGRIRPFDLVYREGESGWVMALEHPEFRDEFKGPGRRVENEAMGRFAAEEFRWRRLRDHRTILDGRGA
ncbi:MAG: DUF4339 domain-containing protein [Calothrix sp. SM1_5_4]|nr:DUF4339 domain-containing protein [Calothrix sp. SM1_5_4]